MDGHEKRKNARKENDAWPATYVELHVMSEPRGHTTPQGSSKLAADWIHRHLTNGVDRNAATNAPPNLCVALFER